MSCTCAGAAAARVGGVHTRHGLQCCALLLGISQQQLDDACEEEERHQPAGPQVQQQEQQQQGQAEQDGEHEYQVGLRQQCLELNPACIYQAMHVYIKPCMRILLTAIMDGCQQCLSHACHAHRPIYRYACHDCCARSELSSSAGVRVR
jgi:hypothetical protein